MRLSLREKQIPSQNLDEPDCFQIGIIIYLPLPNRTTRIVLKAIAISNQRE
jgi:hypothetical protein